MAEDLAGRGFAAATMTYRFWPDWPCPAAIDDAQRAVRWLRRHAGRYGLDPARFAAMGSSAGGHLASYLGLCETRDNNDPDLAAYSSRVQCVGDFCGPVDLVGMMTSASAPIVEGFMGRPLAGAEEEYRRASPFHLVSPGAPPFLIVHGSLDTGETQGQVPIDQSERFAARLKAAGADAAFLCLEGAGHGFATDPATDHARIMWQAVVPFLHRHLGLGVGS
jgi:acetyl esterase/lipase